MDGTISLTQAEACEAVRAYLQLRGALPAHGRVLEVGKDEASRYGSTGSVKVSVEIGDAPVPAPERSPDNAQGA